MDEMKNKLAFLLTKEAYNNAHFKFIETKDGLIVRFDTHGQSAREARRFINNIAATNRNPFFLHVIHGFNQGTVIKDMLRYENINPRFIRVKSQKGNPGESIIKVSAA